MDYIKIRNNTSFPYTVKQLLSKVNKDDVLQYHQKVVCDFVMAYPNIRGLLIYHNMGSGKTILALSICEILQRKYPTYRKIFLVQRSLRENVIRNMDKIGVNSDGYIFISSNANNLIDQIERKFSTLNNTILVIDEVHNFCNSILGGSNNATRLYRKILEAKHIKLFFLSGTVIVSDPHELGICLNMINGLIDGTLTLFPEYYDTFTEYFGTGNDDKFMSRAYGLISYYNSKGDMPDIKPMREIYVPMSKLQSELYAAERRQEDLMTPIIKGSTKSQPLIKKSMTTSSYRIHTRQICNIVFPPEAHDTVLNEYGQKRQKRNVSKLPSDFFTEKNIKIHAPKFIKAREIIESYNNKKGYVYSQFLDSGIITFALYLEANGYERYTSSTTATIKSKKFCIVSGDTENDDRERILTVFNSQQNLNGDIIKVLLMSAAVSQGISLIATHYVIIMESYWNWTRIIQTERRGVRFDSHTMLPEKERYFDSYILLAELSSSTVTTDIEIYKRALENQKYIDRFLALAKRSSIDCFLSDDNKDCFTCKPTNLPLYISNIHADIRNPITCEKWITHEINAKQIVVQNKTYYYTYDTDNVLHMYKWDDFLNTHRELLINDDDYAIVYDTITQK